MDVSHERRYLVPKGAGKPYHTIEEFLEDAKQQLAEIAEDGIKQTNWCL